MLSNGATSRARKTRNKPLPLLQPALKTLHPLLVVPGAAVAVGALPPGEEVQLHVADGARLHVVIIARILQLHPMAETLQPVR
jgi:hypothetical protein